MKHQIFYFEFNLCTGDIFESDLGQKIVHRIIEYAGVMLVGIGSKLLTDF